MNTEERERFITAWITLAEAQYNTAPHKENFWAHIYMSELTDGLSWGGSAEKADEAWELIQVINQCPLSDEAIAYLAAGPLENLLSHHGEVFIERVEELARRDPNFNKLLGGVWRNAMSDEIWERVQAARHEVW